MYFHLSLLQCEAQPSLGWYGPSRRSDLWELGWRLLSLSHHPSDVSFSLAASVPESQESQGPGPVSGAQQVAAGMRSVAPPFVLSLAPAQVEQADTAVGRTLLIPPFLLPSAFAALTGP